MNHPERLLRRIRHDEAIETPKGILKIRCRRIGEVVIDRGWMILCSPEACGERGLEDPRYHIKINPGRYPVIVGIAENETAATSLVASASVLLGDTLPVQWELAPRTVYSEHAELDAFMDVRAQEEFADRMLEDEQGAWADMWRRLKDNSLGRVCWADIALDERTGLNMVAYANGGDVGSRGNGFGYDQRGQVVCVTNFFQLPGDSEGIWDPFK